MNFYKLFRSSGGARKVALGFAIGFGLEMIVLSTASLVYLVFYPAVRLSGGSLPAAVIGNVVGKLTFLPVVLLPVAHAIGKLLIPFRVHGRPHIPHEHSFWELLSGNPMLVIKDVLQSGLYTLVGMSIIGAVLGTISYFVVHYLYEKERQRRLEKRKGRAQAAVLRA
nr:DUF2062 domain-containing protein [Ectobacillus ponti]